MRKEMTEKLPELEPYGKDLTAITVQVWAGCIAALVAFLIGRAFLPDDAEFFLAYWSYFAIGSLAYAVTLPKNFYRQGYAEFFGIKDERWKAVRSAFLSLFTYAAEYVIYRSLWWLGKSLSLSPERILALAYVAGAVIVHYHRSRIRDLQGADFRAAYRVANLDPERRQEFARAVKEAVGD